ncbi:MAG: transporter substrate-binding domain-containing protein [Alteromonadaceae bacterium]|nr:transporter substrate-binding domain-containing protein [Alteromonadaceae bacterium]
MRLIFTFFVSLFSCLSQACELAVQIVEYPPLAYRNVQGNWEGLNKLYVDALLNEAGCTYKFIETPFARGLQMVDSGQLDMVIDVSRTPEREAKYHFIGPQRIETILLVGRKKAIPTIVTWNDMQSLDARLVRQRGSFYGSKLEEVLLTNKRLHWRVEAIADNKTILQLVINEKADAFFLESSHWQYLKKDNSIKDKLEVHPLIINAEPVYYALSKTSVSEQLIQKLNAAFVELTKDNSLKAMEEKFFDSLGKNGGH